MAAFVEDAHSSGLQFFLSSDGSCQGRIYLPTESDTWAVQTLSPVLTKQTKALLLHERLPLHSHLWFLSHKGQCCLEVRGLD